MILKNGFVRFQLSIINNPEDLGSISGRGERIRKGQVGVLVVTVVKTKTKQVE